MDPVSQSADAAHAPEPSGFVSETYCRYKLHTEAFLTWLVGQVGSNRFASTQDYVIAAEGLRATDPLLRVPQGVLKHLQDAIRLRRECTAYYEARSLPGITSTHGSRSGDIESQGHRHFTGVLEQVKLILSPAIIEDQTTPLKAQATRSEDISHIQQQHQSQAPFTFNYYDSLFVENSRPDESTLPQKFVLPIVEPPKQSSQGQKLSMREDDALLAMYCLVDDLNRVKTSVITMWEEYRDLKLSLVNAAESSNTLLCYAEYLETSFYNEYRDIIPQEQLLEHILPRSPGQKEAKVNVSWLSDDDFPRVVLDHLNAWRVSDQNGVLVKDGSRKDNPDTTGLNPMQVRRARQITFLREVLLEYRTMFAVYFFPLAVDQVAHAFLQLTRGENVSLWMIVSVQMLIEIKQLLGPDVSRGLSEVQSSARNIVATLEEYKRLESRPDLTSNQPQARKAAELRLTNIEGVLDLVLENVLDDRISRIKRVCFPPSLSILIGPQQEYFLLANHPILCGRYEFLMKAQFQNVAMITASWQDVLLGAAHLYNACRIEDDFPDWWHIEGGLQTSWGRMDEMLRVWGNESLFMTKRPSDFGSALRHFGLRLGAPVDAFARTSRRSEVPLILPRDFNKFRYTRSFDHLIAFSLKEQSVDERPSVEHLRLLLVHEAQDQKGRSGSQDELSGPLIFREQLNGLFAANEEKLNFNLIYMYRLCARLLRNLAARSGDAFKWRREHKGGFELRRHASYFPVSVLEDVNNRADFGTQLSGFITLADAGNYINVFARVVERLEASGYLPNSMHSPVTEETCQLRAGDEEGFDAVTKEDGLIVRGDTKTDIDISQKGKEHPTSTDSAAAGEPATVHTDRPEAEGSIHDGRNETQNPLIRPHRVVPDEPGWKRYYFPRINSSPTAAKRAEIKAEVEAIYQYNDGDAWVEGTVDQIWAYRGAEEA